MDRKKVLITGAASGIGMATAIRFANEGYDVCINDIQGEKLESLFNDLTEGNHLLLYGNYAEHEVIHKGNELIGKNWGRLDALINCAGLFEKTDPIEMEIDRWRLIFDSMVNGCLLASKLSVRFMDKGGRIIHMTSIHGNRAEKVQAAMQWQRQRSTNSADPWH